MEFIEAKSLVSGYVENNSWFGVNYNMNIYKGCCHGCIYCDSRSECYGVVDFDKVRAKKDSTLIIRRDLKMKKKKGVIGTGAMSDPYNPFEKQLCLTREALKQINENSFGVSIITKSPLITRDIDLLNEIKKHSPVLVKITITTFDDDLCKKIEPNVAKSSERFKAIKELSDNGIYVGVLLMPILPFINDTGENIRNIVRKAHESGARFVFAYGMGVTLRGNQREYYYERLLKLFPQRGLAQKYIETYGNSYECSSVRSKELWKVFKTECDRFGLAYRMEDIIVGYREGYEKEQISWF